MKKFICALTAFAVLSAAVVPAFATDNEKLVDAANEALEIFNVKIRWNSFMKRYEITNKNYKVDEEAWKENTGEISLDDLSVKGDGVSVKDNVVYILKGGDFTVSGKNDNAMIYVNTRERVKLRLDSITLTNKTGPAIFFDDTDKAFITVKKGSENFICDGEEYSFEAKAAIFANDDLEIKGEGTLNVISKAHHAIASDDDIKIEEGNLVLTAEVKDAVHANNTIKIQGGTISVTAKGDGIASEEDVKIEGGTINVTTTGEVKTEEGFFGGNMGGDRGWKGNRGEGNFQGKMRPEGMTMPEGFQRPEGMMPPEGMTMPEDFQPPEGIMPPEGMTMPEGFQPPEGMMPPEGMTPPQTEETNEENSLPSTKGIKAETDITITGGVINVNAKDHAIHSSGTINISGGEMNLTSDKGKGISSHGNFVIDSGVINVLKATEGLESKLDFTINDGTIKVTATDDGINAGGTGGRDVANRGNVTAETEHDLIINGGNIFVNAQGDGLDANGRMIINGGNIVVEGPTNNGNGALDSGGVILVNGGNLIALGASGMAETPSNQSKAYSFKIVTEEEITEGSTIKIKTSSGKEIYSYKTIKKGNSVVFSSPDLIKGEAYTVTVNNKDYSLTLNDIVTNLGNANFGRGGRW